MLKDRLQGFFLGGCFESEDCTLLEEPGQCSAKPKVCTDSKTSRDRFQASSTYALGSNSGRTAEGSNTLRSTLDPLNCGGLSHLENPRCGKCRSRRPGCRDKVSGNAHHLTDKDNNGCLARKNMADGRGGVAEPVIG